MIKSNKNSLEYISDLSSTLSSAFVLDQINILRSHREEKNLITVIVSAF